MMYGNTRLGFDPVTPFHESNTLTIHELNEVLPLLGYKFILPTYNINNTKFVGLEVCVIGK
jgi:hypothetical protein